MTARTVDPTRRAVAAEEDDRRSAVARDVGAAGVDHVREVVDRDPLLDELLAELALHERVGRDHADVAGTVAVDPLVPRKLPEPLGERARRGCTCRWHVANRAR